MCNATLYKKCKPRFLRLSNYTYTTPFLSVFFLHTCAQKHDISVTGQQTSYKYTLC